MSSVPLTSAPAFNISLSNLKHAYSCFSDAFSNFLSCSTVTSASQVEGVYPAAVEAGTSAAVQPVQQSMESSGVALVDQEAKSTFQERLAKELSPRNRYPGFLRQQNRNLLLPKNMRLL